MSPGEVCFFLSSCLQGGTVVGEMVLNAPLGNTAFSDADVEMSTGLLPPLAPGCGITIMSVPFNSSHFFVCCVISLNTQKTPVCDSDSYRELQSPCSVSRRVIKDTMESVLGVRDTTLPQGAEVMPQYAREQAGFLSSCTYSNLQSFQSFLFYLTNASGVPAWESHSHPHADRW